MATVNATIPLVKQTFPAGTSPNALLVRIRNTATGAYPKTKQIPASDLPAIPADGSAASVTVEFTDVLDGGYELRVQRLKLVSGQLQNLGAEAVIPFAVPGTPADALVVGVSADFTVTVSA